MVFCCKISCVANYALIMEKNVAKSCARGEKWQIWGLYMSVSYFLKVVKFAESAFQFHNICVNLNDNILRQRCVNHQISKNFVSKGHFCWGYTLFKCLNLRFKQWLNIIWGILQFYLWKQWNLDSFSVLSQSFCGKF